MQYLKHIWKHKKHKAELGSLSDMYVSICNTEDAACQFKVGVWQPGHNKLWLCVVGTACFITDLGSG